MENGSNLNVYQNVWCCILRHLCGKDTNGDKKMRKNWLHTFYKTRDVWRKQFSPQTTRKSWKSWERDVRCSMSWLVLSGLLQIRVIITWAFTMLFWPLQIFHFEIFRYNLKSRRCGKTQSWEWEIIQFSDESWNWIFE